MCERRRRAACSIHFFAISAYVIHWYKFACSREWGMHYFSMESTVLKSYASLP
jgi:hypothetical protein